MMEYEEPNETLKDKSACAGVRADLKMCLLKSECCQVVCCLNFAWYKQEPNNRSYFQQKKTPRECLKLNDGTVPTECYVLRNTFFECKRSLVICLHLYIFALCNTDNLQLDNRQRFRGHKGY